MSWQFYQHNGRWAIWSTVVDDWIVADLSREEVIKFYTEEKAQRAREKAKTDARVRTKTIADGGDAYYGRGPDEEILKIRGKYEDIVEMHSD